MLKAHTGTVRCVHFSADGRMLATASDDKTVKLWSLPAQRFVCTLAGHSNWVRTAQISPDGRLVASAGDDRCIRVGGGRGGGGWWVQRWVCCVVLQCGVGEEAGVCDMQALNETERWRWGCGVL